MAKKTAKKKTAKKNKPEGKVGKPKRVFTPAQIKKMNTLALNGCQNNTIASIMDIPLQTLVDNFRGVLTKKRAERKNTLRKHQMKAAKNGNPALLIFLGKNELGQKDKREDTIGITDDLATLMKEIGGVGACLPIKTQNKV
jgi:hypothetical protein